MTLLSDAVRGFAIPALFCSRPSHSVSMPVASLLLQFYPSLLRRRSELFRCGSRHCLAHLLRRFAVLVHRLSAQFLSYSPRRLSHPSPLCSSVRFSGAFPFRSLPCGSCATGVGAPPCLRHSHHLRSHSTRRHSIPALICSNPIHDSTVRFHLCSHRLPSVPNQVSAVLFHF